MRWIRRIHSWLGVLFAPSILFFVLSGMFQIAGCHEAEPGDEPPGWIARMARLHMKQTLEMPRKRSPPPAASPRGSTATASPAMSPAPKPVPPTTMPLKLFFFTMAIAVMSSTLFGLYMAFAPRRDRKLLAGLLATGAVLPIVLMML
jgi:hypothetical protein